MFKKLGWGAMIALTTAAAVAGCSSGGGGGGGIFTPTELDLPSGGAPASAISTNNLAPDGGAFSHNNQNAVALQCYFNGAGPSGSQSTTQGCADSSGVGVFTTRDNNGSLNERLWATHWDGSTLTAPVELTGEDRDETRNSVTTNVASVLCCPLNVKNYVGTNGQALSTVTANEGNWVLVWDAITAKKVPLVNDARNGPGSLRTAILGPHRTLYYTLFLKSLRSKTSAFSQVLGFGVGGSGTPTTASREYRNGFLYRAVEIPDHRAGEVLLNTGAPDVNIGNTVRRSRPAEDVISYGMATDTIRGCAKFTAAGGQGGAGTAGEPVGIEIGSPRNFNLGGSAGAALLRAGQVGTCTTNSGNNLTGAGTGGTAVPGGAGYAIGDCTTFLRLFYVQIATSEAGSSYSGFDATQTGFAASGGGQNNFGVPVAGAAPTQHGGHRYVLYTVGFDLAKLQFGTPTAVTNAAYPASRNAAGTPWGTMPLPNFRTYNQHVFIRYQDASLNGETNPGSGVTLGRNGHQLTVANMTQAMAIFTVTNVGDGTCTLNNNPFDATILGTGGKHNVLVPKEQGGAFGVGNVPSPQDVQGVDEVVDFQLYNTCCNDCPIYGQDHGLADTVVFLIAQADTTNRTATGGTIGSPGVAVGNAATEEVRLFSVGINTNGTQATNSPVIISEHATQQIGIDGANTSTGENVVDGKAHSLRQQVADSVVDYGTAMSRDGTYILVGFRQYGGSTLGANVSLKVAVYRTQRTGGSAIDFAQRHSAKPNQTLNSTFAITTRGDLGSQGSPRQNTVGVSAGARTLIAPAEGIAGNAVSPVSNWSATPDQAAGGNDAADLYNVGTYPMLLASVPVTSWCFQGHLGYACGYQSNVLKMSLLYVLGDGTEDRVFIRQVTVAVATPPTYVLGTEAEIDGTAAVSGLGDPDSFDATRIPIKTSFRWLPRMVSIARDFCTTDAGADAAGAGGAVLMMFVKITDATTTDGTFYNREIFAQVYDGATLGTKVVISRAATTTGVSFHENNQNIGDVGQAGLNVVGAYYPHLAATTGFAHFAGNAVQLPGTLAGNGSWLTFLAAAPAGCACPIVTPNNSDFSTKPSYSADLSYVLMNLSSTDSNLGTAVLWARTFDHTSRRGSQTGGTTTTVPTFDAQWIPATDTASSGAKMLEPFRLDKDLGSTAAVIKVYQDSKTALVVFQQDGHYWSTSTTDGKKWSADSAGKPAPQLVDDNSSQNVLAFQSCDKTTSSCDNLHGSIFGFAKFDLNSNTDIRLYERL